MPDITMCKGTGCSQRDRCYRFTATPSEFRQPYFSRPPFMQRVGDDGQTSVEVCSYLMPIAAKESA